MKKALLVLSILIYLSSFSFAQSHEGHNHTIKAVPPEQGTFGSATFSCGWEGQDIINMKSFSSNAEAEAVMNDIMSVLGLRSNYKIQAAKVPNAAAVVYGDQRYIYYNPKFITNVTDATNTNWASISIVAHEIGHHLNGHTLKAGGSQRHMEIEADEFSGFVLRKMGASLAEAQIAMRRLASERGTATHPGRAERLSAIEKGWRSADAQIASYNRRTSVPSNEQNTPTESRPTEDTSTVDAEDTPSTSSNPSSTTRTPAPPAFAAYRISLRSNPSKEYYITTRYNFVAIRDGKVNILGKLAETENERYPYKIDFDNEQITDLLISRKGELYSMKGKVVGSLTRVRREQPAAHSFLGIEMQR
ncbi:MAG: hypothetical protein AAF849_07765 [Bacteroidota bacterium]